MTGIYSADILIASPLGLRIAVGAEGEERKQNFDFLSSLEIVVLDQVPPIPSVILCRIAHDWMQADSFLMQNWQHMLHIFEHMNRIPQDQHGVDISRMRHYVLEGWAKYFRQTIVLSAFPTPEFNSLFNRYCHNFFGKVSSVES